MINSINNFVVHNGGYTGITSAANITEERMSAIQWARADLLNNPDLGFNKPLMKNMSSVYEVGMNFLTKPEIVFAGCDAPFTPEQAMVLFNQTLAKSNVQSFMNPANYY